ncbi:hypothetical protein DES53_10488 [Roseimicrobium gellanilyticum]|uniref:Uncharacterized protein n=1 Tax=Roseimicrobium gellanilyticum TaxID=748857 RepID=A0A366HMA6_9BACT|nr:hypothetical protein DES53_10488 [Roseimicrobium gellanilyticum]
MLNAESVLQRSRIVEEVTLISCFSVEPILGSNALSGQPKVALASQADLGLAVFNAFGVNAATDWIKIFQ